jgi:hypothetical protein
MSIFIAELGIEYRIRPAGNYHRTGQEDGGVLPGAKRKLPIILCHGAGVFNGISE